MGLQLIVGVRFGTNAKNGSFLIYGSTSNQIVLAPGITLGICISLINHFDPIDSKYSEGPSRSH